MLPTAPRSRLRPQSVRGGQRGRATSVCDYRRKVFTRSERATWHPCRSGRQLEFSGVRLKAAAR